jgi:hypothetical protein
MEDFPTRILLPVLVILLIAGLFLFFMTLYLQNIKESMASQPSSGSVAFQTENTGVENETPASEETILWGAP